jgi:hypothetical protein
VSHVSEELPASIIRIVQEEEIFEISEDGGLCET